MTDKKRLTDEELDAVEACSNRRAGGGGEYGRAILTRWAKTGHYGEFKPDTDDAAMPYLLLEAVAELRRKRVLLQKITAWIDYHGQSTRPGVCGWCGGEDGRADHVEGCPGPELEREVRG